MNLHFILGTAAELIKVYPVIHQGLQRGHNVRVFMTGQSRENFLNQYRDFSLPENLLSSLFESQGDLREAKTALFFLLRSYWQGKSFAPRLMPAQQAPTFVLVHGDTLSTLLGARLGQAAGLPVVHIEAGLRSASLLNPFPEEITRRWVSRLATWHMVPDSVAQKNLQRAKVKGSIVSTGQNTLIDAVRLCHVNSTRAQARSPRPLAVANLHRFENLNSGERWQVIVETVLKAAKTHHVLFVTHPQTAHKLAQSAEDKNRLVKAGVEIVDRMPFKAFINKVSEAEFLISDGGSNQEECFYLGKPCLLLRLSTERREGLDSCCILSRFSTSVIDNFLADPKKFEGQSQLGQDQASPSEIVISTLENASLERSS